MFPSSVSVSFLTGQASDLQSPTLTELSTATEGDELQPVFSLLMSQEQMFMVAFMVVSVALMGPAGAAGSSFVAGTASAPVRGL